MKHTLTDPSILQFTQAIHDVGGGVISDRWIATAFSAANEWIAGSLESAAYGSGPIPTPLVVSWQWMSGSVNVVIKRD